MKSRPIQALKSNLGSRFYSRKSSWRIRNRQSRPDAAPRAARLTLATKAHMAPARAATSTRPATPGPRCGTRYAVSRLRWGALRGVDACRQAGPTVPQSSIVGSTDDCHISPPIAKPEAARDRRADRLPDDVAAHHEAVLEAWFGVSMTGVDVERPLRITAVDHVAAVEESGTPTAERPKC